MDDLLILWEEQEQREGEGPDRQPNGTELAKSELAKSDTSEMKKYFFIFSPSTGSGIYFMRHLNLTS